MKNRTPTLALHEFTADDVREAFSKCHLEETHNFLQDDLNKMADAFVALAQKKIMRSEREACLEVVRSLNTQVANKLQEVRGHL
jgi:hypothetical protein